MENSLFDWLIERRHFQGVLIVLAALWLPLVLVFARLWHRGDNPLAASRTFFWLALALGPLALLLWVVYNLIMDALGLDSVAGLLINLALFVSVGIFGGRILRRVAERGDGAG